MELNPQVCLLFYTEWQRGNRSMLMWHYPGVLFQHTHTHLHFRLERGANSYWLINTAFYSKKHRFVYKWGNDFGKVGDILFDIYFPEAKIICIIYLHAGFGTCGWLRWYPLRIYPLSACGWLNSKTHFWLLCCTAAESCSVFMSLFFCHLEVNSTLRCCLSQSSEHLSSTAAVNGVPVRGEVQSPFL